MTRSKRLLATFTALAVISSPVFATNRADAVPLREAAPISQAEQLFGEDGAGWILFLLLAAGAAAILILGHEDTPASP